MAPYDRAALRQAVRARNIERLEIILETVKDHGLNAVLYREVVEARNLLNILKRMMIIRASLQGLTQNMLNELVEEQSPHIIMFTIMKAVMLMLGVPENQLESWSDIKEQLGTTARKNYYFIKRMVKVKSATIMVEDARRAAHILSRFNLDQERVESISEPLGLFYTWFTTLSEEVISIAEAGFVED